MKHFAVIGAGGFGREVMPLLQAQLAGREDGPHDVRFVIEGDIEAETTTNHLPVCSFADFLALPGERFFNIAIADSMQRARIAGLAVAAGAKPLSIRASTALDLCTNVMGDGAIICPFAMLTSNVELGRYVHLNIYAYVAHDCRIGDFVTFAPAVKCNGNVHIAEHGLHWHGRRYPPRVCRKAAPDRSPRGRRHGRGSDQGRARWHHGRGQPCSPNRLLPGHLSPASVGLHMVVTNPSTRKARPRRDTRSPASPSAAVAEAAPPSRADLGDLEALLLESREELARLVRQTEVRVTSATLAREAAEAERNQAVAAYERLVGALSNSSWHSAVMRRMPARNLRPRSPTGSKVPNSSALHITL